MINPFRNTIANDPWKFHETDVLEINAAAFQACRDAFDLVNAQQHSTSVLIFGESGTGKTHLLGRLHNWVGKQRQPSAFVSVRLQPSPHRFWRLVRREFAESLLQTLHNGQTQLEFLCLTRLVDFAKENRVKEIAKGDVEKYVFNHLPELLEEFGEKNRLSINLCRFIEHFLSNHHRHNAIEWLKGNSLSEEVAEKLGITEAFDEDENTEDIAREFVLELCRFIGTGIPVIFCFDQMEAMQRYPGDRNGLFVFAQAIRTLHDRTDNLLLVSCIQTFFFNLLKEAVFESDFDALAVQRVTLEFLDLNLAKRLMQARLETDNNFSVASRQKLADNLQLRLSDYIDDMQGKTARKILSFCADQFDFLEKGVSTDDKNLPGQREVNLYLDEERESREEALIPQITPEKMDEILQNALPSILNIFEAQWKENDQDRPWDVDVVLEGTNSRTGIVFCNERNGTRLAAHVRRLLKKRDRMNIDQLILVRHPELPIGQRAVKTKQYLKQLQQKKTTLLFPAPDTLALLETLRTLLDDSKSGDLADGERTVEEKTVAAWIKNQLNGSLADFLEVCTSGNRPLSEENGQLLMELLEVLNKERVIALEKAAQLLEIDQNVLYKLASNHPGQIGYLAGPPSVLFQFISSAC